MKGAIALPIVVVVLLTASMGLTHAASAQTPRPTQTPNSTATPSLSQPTELVVQGTGITWSDQSQGEDGYRVTVSLGAETRTFDLPANATRFDYPADFRPGCGVPGRSIASVTVMAVGDGRTSEAATGSTGVECAPATAASTPTPAPILPATGVRADDSYSHWVKLGGLLVLAGVATTIVGIASLRATRAR
jgi:hypothetical protein